MLRVGRAVSDKPALGEQQEAYDRRARTIAFLHPQASVAAADRIAQRGKTIRDQSEEAAWRREAIALLLAAGCFAWGLAIFGCFYLIARGF